MSTNDEQVPTAECRICQVDVPAGEYCGLCGCHLTPRPGEGPDWLRIRDFGAAPGEHLLQPSLASSLFPHLPPRSRTVFRVRACGGAHSAGRVRAAAVARRARHGRRAGLPVPVHALSARIRRVRRHPRAHMGAHRGAGHRAWGRMGAVDGRDDGPVVRNCVGRGHRWGPHVAHGYWHPAGRGDPHADARGDRAAAAAAHAGSIGRLHDWGAGRALASPRPRR